MDFSSLLTDARNIDKFIRTKAEEKLSELAGKSFAEFIYNLAVELNSEEKFKENRQLAGTIIKNCLKSQTKKQQEWLKLTNQQNSAIKKLVLSALASKCREARKAASFVVAYIYVVELLPGNWPELLEKLVETISDNSSDLYIKTSCVETLGYIFEEISGKDVKVEEINIIYNSLFMLLTNSNDFNLSLAVLNTVLNTVPFSQKIFKNKAETNTFFEIILNKTYLKYKNESKIEDLISIIMKILTEYVNNFYRYVDQNLMTLIFEFSFEIFGNYAKFENAIIYNFEFWISLAEHELELSDTKEYKGFVEKLSINLIKQICIFIKFFNEDDEETDWDMSKSAVTLLRLIVQFSGKEVIENLFTYTKQCLDSSDWKSKNEGLLFLGCVIETNFTEEIRSLLKSSIKDLLPYLFDKNITLRKTFSWLLAQITELHFKIFDKLLLDTVIPVLINSFNDKNVVVVNVCSSLINLIKNLGDLDTLRNSNSLSSYFEVLFKELVALANKEQSYDTDNNLCMSAFLTISCLIENSSLDKQDKLEEILIFQMNYLEGLIENQKIKNDKRYDLIKYTVNVIESIFKKSLTPIKTDFVEKFFYLIEKTFKENQGVYEEAISSISSLSTNQGEKFSYLVDRVLPYLKYALTRHNETLLLKVSVMAVGEISKSLNSGFSKYMNVFVPELFQILTNENVDKHVVVLTIQILGDISLINPQDFIIYAEKLITNLLEACKIVLDSEEVFDDDEDDENYIENLKLSLVETFTSIAFAMKDCNKEKEFAVYVPTIFEFLKNLTHEDNDLPNKLLKAIIGFVADMCSMYGKEIKPLILNNPFIRNTLQKLQANKNKKNAEFFDWAEMTITSAIL